MNKNIKRRTLSESSKNAKLRRIQSLLESLINESSEANTDEVLEDKIDSLNTKFDVNLDRGNLIAIDYNFGMFNMPASIIICKNNGSLITYGFDTGEIEEFKLDYVSQILEEFDFTKNEIYDIMKKARIYSKDEAFSELDLPREYRDAYDTGDDFEDWDDLDESLDRATSLQNHLMQQLQKPGSVLEGEMICGRDERPYTVMFFMRDEGLACYEEWSGEVSLLDSLIDFYKDYDYTEDELIKMLRKMELTSAKEATSWFLPKDYLTREPF